MSPHSPKIVMIVSNRYDPDPRVHKEAVCLVRSGYQVKIYAFDRQCEKQHQQEIVDGVEIIRLQLGRFVYGRLSSVRGLAAFQAAVRQALLRDHPDIVHCHDHDTCAIGVWWQSRGAQLCGQRKGRFVYDVHDLYWTYFDEKNKRILTLASTAIKLIDRFYARRADLLITITSGLGKHEGLASIYQRWDCKPLVIRNLPARPTHLPAFPPKWTVGYFGAIRFENMFRWLVEAVIQLPPALRPRLRIAGSGVSSDAVRNFIETQTRIHHLDVKITGRFSADEIPALMAECSVQYCVYPSSPNNLRGVPVKLAEAVAYGRPIIGTAGMLMEEWIKDNEWGWTVIPGDVVGLAAILRHIAEQRADLFHTPNKIKSPPFWEDEQKHLISAYQKLLEEIVCDSQA